MKSKEELRMLLERIDHRGYPAYKETKGAYQFNGYVLAIEHVQGDPFAAPSQVKLIVRGKDADIAPELYDKPHKRIAVQDYLLRRLERDIYKNSYAAKGSGKSGLMSISRCGQEILERSACQIDGQSGDVYVRMEIGFPANGRTINAKELEKILFGILPGIVNGNLYYKNMDKREIAEAAQLAENQQYIRTELKRRDLAAFIADGAVLPRESGISQKPMKGAVKFRSPESMRVEMDLPDGKTISGMGIPRGITLIVGGGYHGKSTLLEALERGVYNHIAGDGREYVLTDETAVKIRAEDGRSIAGTNISMFINNLPNKIDTRKFSTEDASGSTSQAANVVEAMEAGSGVFLIDEDTSATNFMIRDELMQLVVTKDKEPIIPYIDRIRELYEVYGISTILVAGSSGEYFYKADKIVQMEEYNAYDITEYAREKAEEYKPYSEKGKAGCPKAGIARDDLERRISQYKGWFGDRVKIKINGRDELSINKDSIDTRYMEQLVDSEQLRATGYLLRYMHERIFNGRETLGTAIDKVMQILEEKGFEEICGDKCVPGTLAIPRRIEIYMCVNRFRRTKTE